MLTSPQSRIQGDPLLPTAQRNNREDVPGRPRYVFPPLPTQPSSTYPRFFSSSYTYLVQAIPLQREQRTCNLSVAVGVTCDCTPTHPPRALTVGIWNAYICPCWFRCSDGPGAFDFTQVSHFPRVEVLNGSGVSSVGISAEFPAG